MIRRSFAPRPGDETHLPHAGRPGGNAVRRPVILATFSVRIEPAAEWMAIASALEAGVPLIVANVMRLQSPTAMVLLEEELHEVRQTAERARSWGIDAEFLMAMSVRRPTRALLRLAHRHDAGLVVFGPDQERTGRRRYRRAARIVRETLPCLVWTAADMT